MEIITCKKCGYPSMDTNNVCPKCGSSLLDTPTEEKPKHTGKYCINCGAKIMEEAKFCPECGSAQVASRGANEKFDSKKSVDASKGGKKIIWIVVAAICIICLFALFGGGESGSDISDTPSTPTLSKREYIALCQEIDYKEVFRYPDDYKGDYVTVKVQVAQVMDSGGKTTWRAYTLDEEYGWPTTEEFYLIDSRSSDLKILEDDIIIVYGEYRGLAKITRAFGNVTEEVPSISVEYIKIVEE